MLVKICGTTSVQDAQQAVAAGAGALGFIFAPSKRRVTAQLAATITEALPSTCLRVGVFTQPDAAAIVETVRTAGLTAVQLHLRYDEALLTSLREHLGNPVQLWQVVPVETEPLDADQADRHLEVHLSRAFADERLDALLLDTAKAGASGGLGAAFPWARVRKLLDRLALDYSAAATRSPARLMVAGGLTPANVRDTIRLLQPAGVDVVSGVEAAPGRKDPAKVDAFVRAVRAAAAATPDPYPAP